MPSWLSNSRIQLSVSDSSAFPSAAASYGHAGHRGDAAPCHRPTRDPAGRGGGSECVRWTIRSWFGPRRVDRIQVCGAMTSAPQGELPSDRHASHQGKAAGPGL